MDNLPAVVWRGTVLPDWVDFNGHLQDGYYLVIFSKAGEAVMDAIGLDTEGRQQHGHSIFTLECHVNFLAESHEGAAIEVRAQVLGVDGKRLHILLTLHRPDDEALLACSEQMWLNVDMRSRRSSAFAPPVFERVQALYAAHRVFPVSPYVGKKIALPTSVA
jgi:acyl-CoA thioester hydrolase